MGDKALSRQGHVMGALDFIRIIMPYLKSSKLLLLILIPLFIIDVGYCVSFPIFYEPIIDNVGKPNGLETIIFYLTILAIFFVVFSISNVIDEYVTVNISIRVINNIREKIFSILQKMPAGYYAKKKPGDMIAHFTTDLAIVEHTLTEALPLMISSFAQGLIGTIVLFYLEWYLSLISIILLPLIFLISLAFKERAERHGLDRKQREAELTQILDEVADMHVTISLFRLSNLFKNQFLKKLGDISGSYVKGTVYSGLISILTSVALQGISLVILIVGVIMVYKGQITAGRLIAYLTLMDYTVIIWGSFFEYNQILIQASGGVQRIKKFFKDSPALINTKRTEPLNDFIDKIEFKKVSFAYKPEHPILKNISLSIRANDSVAIVGTSGSGKSTLLSLLLGAHDPVSGKILIDGKDYSTISQEFICTKVRAVMQNTSLFDMSIAENIRMGKLDATEQEIIDAAKAAELHETIMQFPQQYETRVGIRGQHLSGGQRQRVAIARALIGNPAILILDEATSDLDPVTEHEIISLIQKIKRHKTIVFVTHRLRAIQDMDFIYVISKGSIVQSGIHENLVKESGFYQQLWHKQLK